MKKVLIPNLYLSSLVMLIPLLILLAELVHLLVTSSVFIWINMIVVLYTLACLGIQLRNKSENNKYFRTFVTLLSVVYGLSVIFTIVWIAVGCFGL
ncbi:hypothetical protein YK48G_18140 [Lentilactobacillus fungorum]|uniref:Uncharacterized protein n=1 Tax=Lentilactobacillus fungorum TaxID=2201250 RepID=A0ABQ3W2P6_9LACO|nr:hypothetical protein YK48G_18140 [Lentilactobacillus fungorum]